MLTVNKQTLSKYNNNDFNKELDYGGLRLSNINFQNVIVYFDFNDINVIINNINNSDVSNLNFKDALITCFYFDTKLNNDLNTNNRLYYNLDQEFIDYNYAQYILKNEIG